MLNRRELLQGMAAGAAAASLLPSVASAAIPTARIATVAPEGTPWSDGLMQFKKKVEGAVGTKLAVRPFLGGVLVRRLLAAGVAAARVLS